MGLQKTLIAWYILALLWTSLDEFLDKTNTCYDGLGCFPIRFPSWHHRSPSTPAEINTTFILITPSTRKTPGMNLTIDMNATRWGDCCREMKRDIKMYIHGFRDSWRNRYSQKMLNTLLDMGVNIIMVDWSGAADTIDYDQARADTRVVGVQVARLIERLTNETSVTLEGIHLIGHSLGAHVAGYAGEALGGRVGRITGLDPAGPEFRGSFTSAESRLDRTDAMFVDVIHTDGEIILAGGFGLMDELGHQDFYPNGGWSQPGCVINPICDHMRAIDLFLESATLSGTEKFASMRRAGNWEKMEEGDFLQCNESSPCPNMGYWADRESREGVYYLETNEESPYSLS